MVIGIARATNKAIDTIDIKSVTESR